MNTRTSAGGSTSRQPSMPPTIVVCVAFTLDLETECHVMVYVIYVISARNCATAMIVKVFGAENLF